MARFGLTLLPWETPGSLHDHHEPENQYWRVVDVALPSIQRDLGAGPGAIEWVVAGFGLTSASFLCWPVSLTAAT